MTKLLQEAFEQAMQLPPEEQDSFAALILHELESEGRWRKLFEQSQDLLEQMADKALTQHRAGLTEPLDPDAM